jgi:hypothetical protein
MTVVEQMFNYNSKGFSDKTKGEQVRLVARRLAVSEISAWRRIERYNQYKRLVTMGKTEEAKKLDWHEKSD